jgi:TonB-dependent SusC/RagA subfamily outer membrane receptor
MQCFGSGVVRHERRRSFAVLGMVALLFPGWMVALDAQTSQAPRRETSPTATSCQEISGDSLGLARTLSGELQGQVAGVQIYQMDGRSGAGTFIRIRGSNSVTGSNMPLVYVDDMRVPQVQVSTVTRRTLTAQSFLNALDMVDPTDVARIEILRGPAATTLYGLDAASGVIRIYTKRGSKGGALGKDRVGCP